MDCFTTFFISLTFLNRCFPLSYFRQHLQKTLKLIQKFKKWYYLYQCASYEFSLSAPNSYPYWTVCSVILEVDSVNISPLPAVMKLSFISRMNWRDTGRQRDFSFGVRWVPIGGILECIWFLQFRALTTLSASVVLGFYNSWLNRVRLTGASSEQPIPAPTQVAL